MGSLKNSGYNGIRNHMESDGVGEERVTLLNDDSDEDEEAIFNTPSSRSRVETAQVHGKLEGVKSEVRKVTHVMLDNVQKVMERGQQLDELEIASDRLVMAGAEFQTSARKARYKGWLQNLLSKYAACTLVLSIFVLIIVTTIIKYS